MIAKSFSSFNQASYDEHLVKNGGALKLFPEAMFDLESYCYHTITKPYNTN